MNDKIEELKELSIPLVMYLKMHYNPLTRIVISEDRILVESDSLSILLDD